jgi:hypothetical protein
MSDLFEFFASTVRCYIENDVLTIGMGDDGEMSDKFVIITRLDEEETVGAGAIGLQTNFTLQEYSNAISVLNVSRHAVEILISKEKEKKIGVGRIRVNYDSDKFSFDEFVRYIHLIFDNCNIDLRMSF